MEDVLLLGKAFRDESGAHLPFDPDWTRDWLEQVMSDTDRAFVNVFIAYRDDMPAGMLIGFARPYVFSSAICASQELWYVVPKHRSQRTAYMLMRAFEEWARLRGAIEIFTGITAGDAETTSRIAGVLTRMGYPLVGTYHKKRTV